MERQVIFRDRQELQAADLNSVQEFTRGSLDHVVADAVTAGSGYAGFTVIQRSVTQIDIAPGRYYRGGAVAVRLDTVTLDLFSHLPLVVKKIVRLVLWTQVVEADVQPRDFLIDAETGQTEPQAVAMESQRFAEINVVAGIESADPQPPTTDASTLAIADVVLGTTGIIEIRMLTDNVLPNLGAVAGRTRALEGWRSITEPRISTIASDIAKLANSIGGLMPTLLFGQFARDVALLKERLDLPDDATFYAADRFLDEHESDLVFAGYNAQVQEGVRFPWDGLHEAQLGLFNPLDAKVRLHADGLLLPAYTEQARLALTAYAGEIGIASYQYQTFEMIQKTMARTRLRYGPTFSVCTNSSWWQTGQLNVGRATTNPYDYWQASTFTKDGETFEIEDVQMLDSVGHQIIRLKQFWVDTEEEPYWDKVTTTITVQGSQIAQTILNSQDGWLTSAGLFFTRVGDGGSVQVALCETYRGAPDLDQVLATVTLPVASLKAYPEETPVVFPPTFLKAGGRYALVITTGGSHFVATVSGGDYAQGTLFYCTDGAYFDGDLTKDLMLKLYFARFDQARVVTELAPLELAGGITAIDILAERVVPASTELVHEIQIAGVWYPLDQYTAGSLVNYPPLLPHRAVFLGTTDVMPGVRLTGSRLRTGRPKTALKHVSTVRTLGAPSSSIKVRLRLEGFDPAHHTCTIKIHDGAAEIAHTSVADTVIDVELGHRYREAIFTLGAPISSYRVVVLGTTDGANHTYHVAERLDWAF